MMAKYKVIRDTYGFPEKTRFYKEGQIVEFGPEVKPPHHFQLMGAREPKASTGIETVGSGRPPAEKPKAAPQAKAQAKAEKPAEKPEAAK
jgi:hypothetical protein